MYAIRSYYEIHEVRNPLNGLKKPPTRLRLHSSSKEDEEALYETTDEAFGDFLLAANHTGLHPFCKLLRLTVRDVPETERGMVWRVYPSKRNNFV